MRSTDFPFAVTPRRYKDGGGVNALRSVGQGMTFGTSDAAEAYLRSLLSGDKYYDVKDRIEGEREAWAAANPGYDLMAQMAGGVVPGLVGAFVPGGQAGAIGALARIARIADAPVERALARFAPGAAGKLAAAWPGRVAVGLGDEMLTGVATSAGQAKTDEDIPAAIVRDAPLNALMALGARGATEGAGYAVRKRRARR
jgi:hypothetical protein